MSTRKKTQKTLTPASFSRLAASREHGSLYVLVGEDAIGMDHLFSFLKKEFIDPDTAEFNLEVMHADSDSVNAGEIVTAAETIPFMGGFRFVFVRHAEELRAADLELLTDYHAKVLADPRPDLLVVLTFTGLDKRTKFAKALYKADSGIECSLGELKDPGRVAQEKFGKTFSAGADAVFRTLVGTDARTAHIELEKVCLYAGERDTISGEDILNVCADSTSRNEWELADMIMKGDFPRTLEVLRDIRNSGIDPIYQFTIISMAISKLPGAKLAVQDHTLLKRWHEFRISRNDPDYTRVCDHLQSLSSQQLVAALRWLMFSEIAVKGSPLPREPLADLACFTASTRGDIQ